MSQKSFNLEIYLVTDRELSLGRPLEWVVEQAARGGVDIVQLREKSMDTRPFIEEGKKLKQLLKPYNVPLLINDRLDVALAIGADGVHIGQKDMPYRTARQLLGKDAIIGLSVETYEQAEEANQYDVDYIAISPVFRTPTKEELNTELGLEGVTTICKMSRHRAIGIGSIKAHNAGDVIRAGAEGVAVVSGICSADDPLQATRDIKEQVKKAKTVSADL
ncbi:MAG: thiamine phosphate synthase [Caldithrix sp.]|nr:thiamine phosphate synthase [Caldithrix sp.]